MPLEETVVQRIRPLRNPRRPAYPDDIARRLPPGQFPTARWPVLHQGNVPAFEPATWVFRVWGAVETPLSLSWESFQELPTASRTGDLHCVTRWSSLDHQWSGVRPETILRLARPLPDARYVLLHGEGGYTANISLAAFLAPDALLATRHANLPLTPEHGAPLRAVIPGLYAWKSVKWLRGVEFLTADRPGFWEEYGYSNSADPWREERFES